MRSRYKHSFDRVIFSNRWKRPRYARGGDWTVVGIGVKWFGPSEYEYVISFFGFDLRIWMKRTWIEKQLK